MGVPFVLIVREDNNMFRHNHETTIVLLAILLLSGCTKSVNLKHHEKAKQTTAFFNNANHNRYSKKVPIKYSRKLKELQPECEYFIKNTKPVTEKNITNCFERVLHEQPPKGFVSYMVEHTNFNNLSKQTLGELLKLFTELRAREFKIVRKLINLGAPTTHISIGLIADYGDQGEQLVVGNARNCKAIEMIIINNRKFYQSGGLYTGRIKMKATDLHNLTRTFDQWYICPRAVKLLSGYNPRMKDISDQTSGTPLDQLFSDFSKVGRDPELAKVLMTKTNINRQVGGNTPLHILLLYSVTDQPSLKAKDKYTVKAMLDMGANIDLKNKNGVTAREEILKRNDLKYLLKT